MRSQPPTACRPKPHGRDAVAPLPDSGVRGQRLAVGDAERQLCRDAIPTLPRQNLPAPFRFGLFNGAGKG